MQQNPNQRMMMNPNANVSQSNLLQQRLTQQRMGVSQAGPQMQPRPGQQQMMVNRMPMHQGGPGGGPAGMAMMRPATAPPVYSINASPQMVQGSSPMMMAAQSPMGSHFVPSPQQAGVPSPGQRMSMAPSPQGVIRAIPSVEMNPQSQSDDQAYLAKIQHLSKYIEPLKKMIAKIGNEDQEKLGKMKKLMDILSNPTKRLDMKVLLRCESVLEHMIRDAPPDVGGHDSTSSSINPLLDSVLKLKRLNSSQSMNHSMYRTFGPPLEAISGAEITLAPPVKRRKRATANTDTEENQLPDHIQGEVAQLHSQFKVALDPSHVALLPNDSIQLQCHLEDPHLPSVPPICVTLGPNYPLDSSPDLHDNAEEYEKSHFLRSVRQALESRVKKLPARHTLTQLLTAWEMGVRSACSFKKRPGSPLVPLVANFSEIATIEYEMSEDYIETTSLTHFALSVPHVCKQILEYLGDKSLMNFRILSHFWKNFVDKQRFTWIRIIKEISEFDRCTHRAPNAQALDYKCNSFVHYFKDQGTLNFYGNVDNNCDNEVYVWKKILEKASLKTVKELGIAIRRLYVLHDDILRSDGTHEKYEDSVFNGIKRYGNKGYHLLIIAAYHGNFELFKEIFELVEDKNPSYNDCPWPSALHTAATFGHFEMCKLILDTLEEKNPSSKTQGSILHIAACYNYQKLFEFVFHQVEEKNPVGGLANWFGFGGVDQNSDHWTPLHYSVANGHYEVSKLIVDEIEIKNPKTPSGWTPLHCASKVELCQLILERVIDKNPETMFGETPLSLAAKSGNVEKFKLFLDLSEDKNPRRKIGCGFTPFDYAVRHGHLPICKIIVEVLSKKLSKDELLQTLANVSRQPKSGSKELSKEVVAWLDGLEFGLKF